MSKLNSHTKQNFFLNLTFKVKVKCTAEELVSVVQLREATVFKQVRSGSCSEKTWWNELWLKAPLLVYFFLALGKHVCWNSQQSARTLSGLTLRLLRLPHMDVWPHGPLSPPAATTAPCPSEGQRIRREDNVCVCVCVFGLVFAVCMHAGLNLCVHLVSLPPLKLHSHCRPSLSITFELLYH